MLQMSGRTGDYPRLVREVKDFAEEHGPMTIGAVFWHWPDFGAIRDEFGDLDWGPHGQTAKLPYGGNVKFVYMDGSERQRDKIMMSQFGAILIKDIDEFSTPDLQVLLCRLRSSRGHPLLWAATSDSGSVGDHGAMWRSSLPGQPAGFAETHSALMGQFGGADG